jgi:large subunit ribosomal protein L7/L12
MGLFFDKPEEPGRTQRLDALESRVQQLEATVAFLSQREGVPAPAATSFAGLSTDLLAQVQRHKREGKPVQAVKIYREATGVGLKEAKAAVDAL